MVFTFAFLTRGSAFQPHAEVRIRVSKSASVNTNQYIASLAALQQRMQPTAAKVVNFCQIAKDMALYWHFYIVF